MGTSRVWAPAVYNYDDADNCIVANADNPPKSLLRSRATTDIASPERTQIGKSKWKEAFGDPFETVERKVRNEIKRRQSMSTAGAGGSTLKLRRASACSMYSEITTDIPEGQPCDDDDEVSPSITPDSSYNGDDYSTEDEASQDGMIVSSKPFSNVISSSHLNSQSRQTDFQTNNQNGGTLEASQLGYEPDNPSVNDGTEDAAKIRDKLGYEEGTPKHSSTQQNRSRSPTKTSGHGRHFASKKALPNPMASRNMSMDFKRDAIRNLSMSDFKREGSVQSLHSPTSPNPQQPEMSKHMAKFQRRFSTSVVGQGTSNNKKYKFRLGILRAVDLSGEAIETYSRGSMTGASLAAASARSGSVKSATGTVAGSICDELDELKVTVIMEQLMTACDVAHNLQSWDHMVKWSNKLFLELKKAHKEGRGGDPKNNWFENQIGFLESYLLPLARRLEDTGVFGDVIGPVFARIVESNRDRWLADGLGVTSNIILEGGKVFPTEGDIVS